jgi:hypothetical protein
MEVAMRLEATVPDSRGAAVVQLDEALGLFHKVIMEVKRGRRLVTLDPQSSQPACELATPTLTALEWSMNPSQMDLPAAALAKVQELVQNPPQPNERLRAAAKRHPR